MRASRRRRRCRQLPTAPGPVPTGFAPGAYRKWGRCRALRGRPPPYRDAINNRMEINMPVILWLLGVPLVVVVLLMLFGVL